MSVFSDIMGDFSKIWASSTWTTRVLIGLSMFFSVSSIASLSDRVYQLKGFIETGIEFYRTSIRTPLVDFASSLGLDFDGDESDTLLLLTLVLVSIARASRARISASVFGEALPGAERREIFIPISERLVGNPSVREWLHMWMTTGLTGLIWLCAVVGFGYADVDASALLWILLTVYTIGAVVLYARISPPDDDADIGRLIMDIYAPREVLRLTTFRLFLAGPILSALIVLIVAAVSEGWTRI